MKTYKTLNQVKQNLPEIIEEITACKNRFNSCTILLEKIQRMCVEEATNESVDYGWWTTPSAYSKFLKAQLNAYAQAEYLQGLVDKLKEYPNL